MPPPRKVLIIDDSSLSRAELEAAFSERGYTVEQALDGVEGLRKLEDAPPDLVLIDVLMPNMDGWEVCRRIRTRLPPDKLTVVVMTSKDTREIMLQAFEVGADEFLQKPMDADELFATVDRLLGERGI